MVRHFVGALFFAFIGLALFVNLFQFSGAQVPFEMVMSSYEYDENSVFGFTSLFRFITTISDDPMLSTGLDWIKQGTSIFQKFSVDQVVSLFVNTRNAQPGVTILVAVFQILATGISGLILPFAYLYALVVIILGVFMFLWQFVAIFCKFLLGYYNYVPVSSGMLSAVNFTQSLSYITPAL